MARLVPMRLFYLQYNSSLEIRICIDNYIHTCMWDAISHPCSPFSWTAVDVSQYMVCIDFYFRHVYEWVWMALLINLACGVTQLNNCFLRLVWYIFVHMRSPKNVILFTFSRNAVSIDGSALWTGSVSDEFWRMSAPGNGRHLFRRYTHYPQECSSGTINNPPVQLTKIMFTSISWKTPDKHSL